MSAYKPWLVCHGLPTKFIVTEVIVIYRINDRTINISGNIIEFNIKISKILEFENIILILVREKKEVPNNVIAYDKQGNMMWKINDIVMAKVERGYYNIEKKSDNILAAYYELGIVFEIDVNEKIVLKKTYFR